MLVVAETGREEQPSTMRFSLSVVVVQRRIGPESQSKEGFWTLGVHRGDRNSPEAELHTPSFVHLILTVTYFVASLLRDLLQAWPSKGSSVQMSRCRSVESG